MSLATVAGMLLVVVPVALNVAFGLLAARFDYPDVLRRPASEVLGRFEAGGTSLVLLWWGFAMTAVLFAPLVVLLSEAVKDADGTLLAVTTTVGVLAAVVQFLGLIRWPFLVPYLARTASQPDATAAQKEAVEVVFQSFNRYLGVGVGEHLGYAPYGRMERAGRNSADADLDRPGVARSSRHRRRREPDAVLAGVRRASRANRLEAGRDAHPHRLHRLVPLAGRYRHSADRLALEAVRPKP